MKHILLSFTAVALLLLPVTNAEAVKIPKIKPPSSVKICSSPSKDIRALQNLLKQEDTLEQFYKEAEALLTIYDKSEIEPDDLTEEVICDRIWLLHLVANAPLLEIKMYKGKWLEPRNNLDSKTRHMILMYVLNVPPLVTGKNPAIQKQLNPLVAEYTAGIMRLFKDICADGASINYNTLETTTPFELQKFPLPTPEEIALKEQEERIKLEEEKKNRAKLIAEGKPVPPRLLGGEILRGNEPAHARWLLKISLEYNRYNDAEHAINSREEPFIQALVRFFPGKKAEVLKYIRKAGYTEEEIPALIDRTVGRDSKTEFLYKGRKDTPKPNTNARLSDAKTLSLSAIEKLALDHQEKLKNDGEKEQKRPKRDAIQLRLLGGEIASIIGEDPPEQEDRIKLEEEIPAFIDRTVGRDSKTEFLYKERKDTPKPNTNARLSDTKTHPLSTIEKLALDHQKELKNGGEDELNKLRLNSLKFSLLKNDESILDKDFSETEEQEKSASDKNKTD